MIKFKIKDDFIRRYTTIVPNFGFNGLGELVYLRTYSRIKEDGTNEQWFETIRRVVEGTYSIQKRHIMQYDLGWDEDKAQESAQEMYDRMFKMKFLPPGRGLWAMGSQVIEERGLYAALNNCFSGNTKFITDKGVYSFREKLGETVNVLTKNGEFKPALVNTFGIQSVNKVKFKPLGLRTNYEIVVNTTANHRWLLQNGNETTNLSVGDVITSNFVQQAIEPDVYDRGFIHGIIFADGTKQTYYKNRFIIRLCGSKNKYLNLLQTSRYYRTTVPQPNGDNIVTLVSPFYDLKGLPNEDSFSSYLKGFIDGWVELDGWQKPGESLCLDTINEQAKDWLFEHAAIGGYSITGFTTANNKTNFGFRTKPLNRISLTKAIVSYKVTEIEANVSEEEVFCVTEPETHSFTLANGLLTGNCAFVSTENLSKELTTPFEFLMDMSMLGVGVGFDVKGANQVKIYAPLTDESMYVIADTREAWVESVKKLLLSYFVEGQPTIKFDYSNIRKEGELIKTFGGKASGYKALLDLHDTIRAQFIDRQGQLVTTTDIVDVMNKIGVCVVAGNVRRTAEIVFGNPYDPEYLKLKDYRWNNDKQEYEGSAVNRSSFGWTSNNSVDAVIGMDYTELARQTAVNGEPGYFWSVNARAYSRMSDQPDWKDIRAKGANPCGEQTLESYEMCCLVETFPTLAESLDDFKRTLKFAYLYAKTVTLGNTHWVETNRVMLRNRRIGTSVSGIAQFLDKNGIDTLKTWLRTGYTTVQTYDSIYSDWLAVPRSIKTTSIKPSGTVSLLPGVTPGIHFPESNHYIRRMRLSSKSELLPALKNANYSIEKDQNSENTLVVSIPVSIEGVRTIDQVSMWEQLQLASFMQEHWSDNQVSVTITFKPAEKDQIKDALNYFQYKLKAVSFLPKLEKGAYNQMPYETITKEQYDDMLKQIKTLKFKSIAEESKPEVFCDGDSCTIL